MRLQKINFTAIIILLCQFVAFGQDSPRITSGEKHNIHSEIIGADKEYWVHLPLNYDSSNQRYPVLYITDGDEHFALASGTADFMSSQYLIPELIVVSIFHKDRNHDLTPTHSKVDLNGFESNAAKVSGGGEKLLDFIENELIPEIEGNYRTGPHRIFSGHSLGGLLSVYAYLTRNELFNTFIAMDPALTWDSNLCERLLKNSGYTASDLSHPLYLSSAHNAPYNKPDKSPFRLSQNAFFKVLKQKQISNVEHEYFEMNNHLTVPYPSFYKGLAFAFNGFYILDDPEFDLDLSLIEAFYEKQSKKYGIAFKPSERLIEMFGKYFLFDLNEYDKSIEFFSYNTTIYPQSSRAFEYLAQACMLAGKNDEAIQHYKKALDLDPGNEEIQSLLKKLKEY